MYSFINQYGKYLLHVYHAPGTENTEMKCTTLPLLCPESNNGDKEREYSCNRVQCAVKEGE